MDGALPTSVYGAMLAIWHLRPAMQRRFPLYKGRRRDWMRFLAWCATDARKDYKILEQIPEWDRELQRELILPDLPDDEWQGLCSVGMFFCGVAIYRWQFSGLLGSAKARNLSARAFWRGRRHEMGCPRAPDWQKHRLREKFQSFGCFLARVKSIKEYFNNEDQLTEKLKLQNLLDAFDGELSFKDESIKLDVRNLSISPAPVPLRVARFLAPVIQFLRRNPTEAERAIVTGKVSNRIFEVGEISSGEFGVNVFGYANGELGIGEDVRQVALALKQAGMPVCIINFQPGKNISQADRSADHLVVKDPKYGINLFCMTGNEHTRYVCENGLDLVQGRYNIGLWPCELHDWPASCWHAYGCVDEIWGISKHAAHAHRHAAPRPVIPMTLPVTLGPVGSQTRKDFGLLEGAYLYFFAFDINSNAARKNPEGLIEAFQKAYPLGSSEKVGLVLKISHPETGCKLWSRIRKAAARDQRIHLVEKTMRRPELLALFNACDCLVSLHRAEGFGRCIAEALLLAKQVVTTGYSGNLDFCQEPRVALVKHRMVPLSKGDYMWGEGQEWAEPDLDHAAQQMRSVRESPRFINSDSFSFSPENVGREYAQRIREVAAQFLTNPIKLTGSKEMPDGVKIAL